MYFFVCLFPPEIGKASPVFQQGAAIGYGGRVIEVDKKSNKKNSLKPV